MSTRDRGGKRYIPQGPRKIVDETELMRWWEEGLTYKEMAERYLEQYNLQVRPQMFSEWRRRRGLPRRISHHEEFVPSTWKMNPRHRYRMEITALRTLAQMWDGKEVSAERQRMAERLLKRVREEGVVVAYAPNTEQGFFMIPREAKDGEAIVRRKMVV